MKAFLVQAAAVVVTGAAIGAYSAPWQAAGMAPDAPQGITVAAQPFQAAGGFQQVGDGSAVAGVTIQANVNGVPGAGTYNLHSTPSGTPGYSLWQTTLENPAGAQVVIQVWRRVIPPPPAASPTISWMGSIHLANFGPPSNDCVAMFLLNGPDFAVSGTGNWSCGGSASISIQ